MKINGIKPIRTRRHKVTTDSNHRLGVAANWLDGDFVAAAPNQKWAGDIRSEEHTSELQSLMRISYAVFYLKKKTNINKRNKEYTEQNQYTTATHTTLII